MVMGSASTMACVIETMGLMLPRGATAPATSAERLRIAVATGRAAVGLQRTPRDVLTREAFDHALTVLAAVGGSTNTIIHLLAIARRAGVDLSLNDFHDAAARVPLMVDCKPAGSGYLEDFHRAGGVPVLLTALEPLLHGVAADADPPGDWQSTIRTLDDPLGPPGALSVLYGSLAPDGAVIKTAAATPGLLQHRGPAVVFESPDDAAERVDDPSLCITPDHVMVLRNAGPVGAGMPEAGSLPIPQYLAEQGVRDIVRVSDARMSGTAYGTVVLHCAPEAAIGGPLAHVRDGDMNVPERRIELLIDESELARRREQFEPPPLPTRGWRRLYAQHVTQADQGADLDFLG
jgi:dihydroxy-acid dehydratase